MTTTPLPPLYARWVEGALGASLPAERRATCHDCAMCGDAAARDGTPAELRFEPGLKCCTYFPLLPNFLVGRILADATPELARGRALVAERVRSRLSATPRGVGPSPAYWNLYSSVLAPSGFGRAPELLCPYLDPRDGGTCSIWRHRDAVCATYFCKHDDGARGARTWQAILQLLGGVESALGGQCLLDLGIPPEAISELYRPTGEARSVAKRELHGFIDDDGRLDPALARRLWGPWFGREEEFYRACAERVEALDWAAVRAVSGTRVAIAAQQARAAWDAQRAPAPLLQVLHRSNVEMTPNEDGSVRVRSQETPLDPLTLPAKVYEALEEFDGRETAVVLEALRAGRGVELDATQLAALTSRAILVAPDGRDLAPNEQPQGPLEPDDRLRLFRGFRAAQTTLTDASDAEGRRVVTLVCGTHELTFDQPELLEFGRKLHAFRNGFRAGDATRWGAALTWESTRELLAGLLTGGALQRLPRAAPVDVEPLTPSRA